MAYPYLPVAHGMQTNGIGDPGACYNGRKESDISYRIVSYALPLLTSVGVKLESDFFGNNDKNIIKCVEEANQLGCDLYVSFHVDSNKDAVGGVMPIIQAGDAQARRFAELAIKNLGEIGLKRRTILEREDDYENLKTNMTSCVLEMGTINNEEDFNILWNKAPQVGKQIAYTILDYYGITRPVDFTTVPYVDSKIPTSLPSPLPPVIDGTPVSVPPVENPAPVAPIMPPVSQDYQVRYETINIQYFLHICNYSPGLAFDNEPGPVTSTGVGNAQRGYQIADDEQWGPVTEQKASGQVGIYQTKLKEKGFYNGEIDGIPGEQTYQAVIDFQNSVGLRADGCIGMNTFNYLINGIAPSDIVEIPAPSGQSYVYFTDDEFKCACGCSGDVLPEIKALADRVRARYGYPLIVTSGFRCPYQNDLDGGVGFSFHMQGMAADIYSPGRMSYDEVEVLANVIVECGGGVIMYHANLFCHMQLEVTKWSMN